MRTLVLALCALVMLSSGARADYAYTSEDESPCMLAAPDPAYPDLGYFVWRTMLRYEFSFQEVCGMRVRGTALDPKKFPLSHDEGLSYFRMMTDSNPDYVLVDMIEDKRDGSIRFIYLVLPHASWISFGSE